MSLISYYSSLLSLEAGLALVLTKKVIVAALGTGLGVSDSLSPRITSFSTYRLGGYLIYSKGELGHIPRVL